MSFKRFLNSHFVFGNEKHISFFQGSSFRFAVITFFIIFYLLVVFRGDKDSEFIRNGIENKGINV